MWEVPTETQQSQDMTNNIIDKISKPELAQYLHASIFIPTTAILLKAIKQGFPEDFASTQRKAYQDAS